MHQRETVVLLIHLIALAACGLENVDPGTPPANSTAKSTQSIDAGVVVTDDGSPLGGAMITLVADGRRTTVFSGDDGIFGGLDRMGSVESVQVRYPGMETVEQSSLNDNSVFMMRPAVDPTANLPSSYWLSLLPDGFERQEFILNCGTCHGIARSRIYSSDTIRDEAMWFAGIAMMRALDAYSVIPPDFDDAAYSGWLATNFSEDKLSSLKQPKPIASDLAERVVITEYEIPKPDSLPHDLVVGPDKRVWITAFFYDQIWVLNPDSGGYRMIDIDDDPDVVAQARALEFGADGRLWVVNGGTNSVIRLNTETEEYESFDVQMYAHSLDLDTHGNVWVNDYFAKEERIASVNVATGEVTIISLPPAKRPASEGIPLPYGLQVDNQNRLYSTQLAANTLIAYDTETGESKSYEMPVENSGPRRPGIAPDGSLWIPEFNTGHITRFDPEAETFERVDLGLATMGAYDIEVDQNSGVVWVTGSLDSSLYRYDPKTARVDRIPLPTEPAYTRHIAIDPDTGDVWSTYSSLPAAKPRVVRIQIADDA